MVKKHKIVLLQEEIDALLALKEVCIFENEEEQIYISLGHSDENILRRDILDRYDNEEYHRRELLDE